MLSTKSTSFKVLKLKVEPLFEEDCSRLQIVKDCKLHQKECVSMLIKHSLEKKAKGAMGEERESKL